MSKGVLKVGLVIAGAAAMFIPGVNAAVAGVLGVSTKVAGALTGIVSTLGMQAATSLIAGSGGKPPPATGSVTQTIIDPNAPQPYVMGEGYVAGVERYRQSWGGTIDRVPNPYLGFLHVYSGGGPADSITPYVDFQSLPPGSWYDGWLLTTTQLGACPEASALLPTGWTGAPNRDATSKLSGQAAIFWTLRFDKDGKRYTGGIPQTGAYGRWVKVYDPRKDSTRAGGSGSHRIGIESTYEWSENPALHAGTYAFGRYQNGKRVLGIGLPDSAIDWPVVAAWANTCDANGWTIFGRIFEPGDRNQNLSDICAAGGGAPVKAGGVLSFHYWAPRVSLDTVTEADLAEDEASVVAMAPWRERINTIVPKYRGGFDQNWEMVDAAKVSVATYVTEDGEEKATAWPWNLVKSVNQAAQLSSYKIQDMRELQPIVITCGPRLRAYRPGECLQLNIPRLGLNTKAVIMKRRRDPARNTVTLTLMGETDGKHAFALGQTTTPPPTPALAQTGQVRDTLFDTVFETSRITGNLTSGGGLPAVNASTFGDTHIGDDGTFYRRVNDGGILLGGFAVTLGGFRPQLAWTVLPNQPVVEAASTATWPGIIGDEKPENNADVTSSITGPASITIDADYTGAVLAGLPRTESYKFLRNGADITTASAWSVSVLSGVITATIGSANGVLNLNLSGGSLTDAKLRITATNSGRSRSFDVTVSKLIAAPPAVGGGSGTSASATFGPDISSATMVAASPELTITIGSAGQAALSATYDYQAFTDGTYNLFARWYRWNGSAYVAIGSEISNTVNATYFATDGIATVGSGSANFTDTGLTPSSSQKYRLYMRGGNATTRSTGGNASAVGS